MYKDSQMEVHRDIKIGKKESVVTVMKEIRVQIDVIEYSNIVVEKIYWFGDSMKEERNGILDLE